MMYSELVSDRLLAERREAVFVVLAPSAFY